MHRQAHHIVLALVVLLALVLLNLPGRTAGRLKLAVGGLFLPLFGLAGSAHALTERVSAELLPRRALLQELDRLRKENDDLRLEVIQEKEVVRENQSLRQQVGWQKRSPWKVKLARVVARDPANWWHTLQIDLGSRNGISTNQAVLSPEGYLAGRVWSVGYDRSEVVLLGDPNCRPSALISETRESGVINPAGAALGGQQFVYLSYLSSSSNMTNGQSVVTSGMGGVFPKGIPIGKIMDKRSVESELYLEAQVKLGANLNLMEEAWVILP